MPGIAGLRGLQLSG